MISAHNCGEYTVPSPEMKAIIGFLKKRRIARERGPARSLFEARESFAPVGRLLPIPDDITIEAANANGVSA